MARAHSGGLPWHLAPCGAQEDSMDTPTVDVVVIGGGVQGLVLLDTLIQVGYSCALVTEGDLGAGQTLHSHGYLNTGFGLGGKELPAAAAQIVHPFLRARGVSLTGAPCHPGQSPCSGSRA